MVARLIFYLLIGLVVCHNNNLADELWLKIIPNVVSPELCAKIIDIAENQVGFPMEVDSIDYGEKTYGKSQAIDVFDKNQNLIHEIMYPIIQPILPKLAEIVKQRKQETWINHKLTKITEYTPDSINTAELGWIFLRKYSPLTPRNMLKIHRDSNIFTINLALNGMNDYKGGGIFFLKPDDNNWIYSDDEYIPPEPSEEIQTYQYLEKIKRLNTSHRIFPDMNTGDILIHNYTVWHGIAPLNSGTRYSIAFFYDMDNPAYNYDGHMDDQDFETMNIKIINLVDDVEDGTIVTVDLYWIALDEDDEPAAEIIVEQDMGYRQVIEQSSYEGHMFRAVHRETGETIVEFRVILGVELYEIMFDRPVPFGEELPKEEL